MLYITYILFVTLMVAADQFSKYLVVKMIPLYDEIKIIDGFFSLTYVRNYGAGFSVLQNETILFKVITIVALIVLAYLLYKSKSNEIAYRIAYLLLISGAIGNFIDRCRYAYVVDFLDFIFFGWDFPIFNVADCFITVGCFILIVLAFMESKNAKC